MTTLEEKLYQRKMSNRFLSGERLPGIMFRHNSKVKISMGNGEQVGGRVVSVELTESEPVYTVECEDRSPDIEVAESGIESMSDPHRSN